MQFIALIYGDETKWESFSDEERKLVYEQHGAFGKAAREAKVLAGGQELDSTSGATTVRVRNGETLVTDGPYAEVKEVLGGFYVLDCSSWDEALDWAAKLPEVEYGAVEVREVHVDEEEAVS